MTTKPEPVNLDGAKAVILAITGDFDNIFIPSGTYDVAGIAVRWVETRGKTHYFSPADRPHPFQLSGTPFDNPDIPEGPLIIGGAKFSQLFPDMSQIIIHVPTDWDVHDDPLYYHQTQDHVFVYNDNISELRWDGKEFGVEFEDGEGFIFSVNEQYDSIAELIEALT
jgi:hypothetical protein